MERIILTETMITYGLKMPSKFNVYPKTKKKKVRIIKDVSSVMKLKSSRKF